MYRLNEICRLYVGGREFISDREVLDALLGQVAPFARIYIARRWLPY